MPPQVSDSFRKTAANFHYEFNMRHLTNVFEGLLKAYPKNFVSGEQLVHLWLHESERVYGDRLVSFDNTIKYLHDINDTNRRIQYGTLRQTAIKPLS